MMTRAAFRFAARRRPVVGRACGAGGAGGRSRRPPARAASQYSNITSTFPSFRRRRRAAGGGGAARGPWNAPKPRRGDRAIERRGITVFLPRARRAARRGPGHYAPHVTYRTKKTRLDRGATASAPTLCTQASLSPSTHRTPRRRDSRHAANPKHVTQPRVAAGWGLVEHRAHRHRSWCAAPRPQTGAAHRVRSVRSATSNATAAALDGAPRAGPVLASPAAVNFFGVPKRPRAEAASYPYYKW